MRRSLLNKQILSKPLRQALVLITLLLLPNAAWGQISGDGSEDNPYVLSSANDLITFASQYNASELESNCYVVLGGNIEFNDQTGFVPIGTPERPFLGTFDGKGKKISGLSYEAGSEDDYAGLFRVIGSDNGTSSVSGSVINLVLENCIIANGKTRNGAIAGMLRKGTIEDCTVTSCHIISETQTTACGGIVGELCSGSLKDCTVNGSTITATSVSGGTAGGIVADITGSATVSGCQVIGTDQKPTTITASSNYDLSSTNYTGGIVGTCIDNSISISNNKVLGNTTISSIDNKGGNNISAGAIVGNNGNASFNNNFYYYTVTTSTKDGEGEAVVEKTGYEQRGCGLTVDGTDEFDIVGLNGIVLYTKNLTIGGLTNGVDGDNAVVSPYYEPLKLSDDVYPIAPGQAVTVTLTPRDGYQPSVVTLTYAMEENGQQNVVNLTNTDTQSGYKYVIEEMPDAEEINGATMSITMVPAGYLGLTVAGVPVTSSNANDIFGQSYGQGYPSASYDETSYLLTLNCAHPTHVSDRPFIAIGRDIETLTVHLKGHSDARGYSTIFTAEAACTVNLTTETSIPGRLEYDSSSSLTDTNVTLNYGTSGLAETTGDYKHIEAEEGTSNIDYFGDGQFHPGDGSGDYPDWTYTSGGIWSFSKAVLTNSDVEQPLTAESSEGILKMKSSGSDDIIKTLTFQCMDISSETTITVTMKGLVGQTTTTYATGTLSNGVITLTPNASVKYDDVYLEFSSQSSFSFVPIAVRTEFLIDVPKILIDSEMKMTFNYQGDRVRYAIDYVSNDDVEETSWTEDDEAIPLAGPCTVTAFVMKNGASSETVTGKYFAIADKTIVFNNETKGSPLTVDDLEIIPATEGEGVSFTFNSANNQEVISYSYTEETGSKFSIAGIGICEVGFRINVNNPTIQVLNPDNPALQDGVRYAEGVVTVIPPAPSFSIEEKEEYLNTDKVELVMPEEIREDQKASIRYSWVETEVNGTEYNSDSKVQLNAGTGTLYAWVRYSQTDADPILSEKVSMTFENVKINIDQFSVKNMLEESPVYQGSAISVPFTLYDPKVETTTISAENYDVIYKKYVGGDEGYETVESVVDVGTYIVSIKGKGSYGGEKLIYENLVVTQASLEDAAISKLIVGEKEYEYDADKGIEIPYTGEAIQPEVVVLFNHGTVTVDASEYQVSWGENNTNVSAEASASVTVTSTGKNFEEGTSTSLNFKIVPAPVTITANNQTVTYNAQQQAYTGASADNENVILAIAYYPSEEERTTGSNALEGAPTDAGTYYVSVTLNEESLQHYTAEPANVTFTIAQLDISDAVITLDKEELTYNGEPQTVNVTKVMAGNIEVPVDCYEVSGNTTGTEAKDYTLTVTAKTMDSSGNPIKNNFTGSREKVWKIKNRTVTTAELGLSENQSQATYYSETEDLEVPEGVVAYIITGVNGNNVVTQRIRYIKKGVAVFVEQTTSTENPLEVIPDASELPLKGTAVDLNVASISGGTVYVLYKGEFVKSTTGTIPAKRCYLLLPNNVAAGTRAFGIIGGGSDGSTAIKSINDEPSTIDNWYDMGGHRIEKPTKTGIYIKNGKKVAIK